MNIIVRKKSSSWRHRKDQLHRRRQYLADAMRPGMMSTSQMKKGESEFMSHDEQVSKYDQWQRANDKNMTEYLEINREFKANGEEGKPHSLDAIRESKTSGKNIKYD